MAQKEIMSGRVREEATNYDRPTATEQGAAPDRLQRRRSFLTLALPAAGELGRSAATRGFLARGIMEDGIKERNMKRMMSLLAITACLVLANAFSASARPVRIWYPNELWEKADLVVIATAEASQDEYKVENAKADTWVPVLTKFDVQAVLKGELEKKSVLEKVSVTVRHNRYYGKMADGRFVIAGPGFVEFNPKAKNQYLIFLAGKPGGAYEPLTGQYDPWQSFLLLQQYQQSKEREK